MSQMSQWELEHEKCQKSHRSITELMTARSKLFKSSSAYANFTEQIVSTLQDLQTGLAYLKSNLPKDLTRGERRRRESLIETLSSKETQLKAIFSQSSLESSRQKEEDRQRRLLLFEGGGVADLGQADDWVSIPCSTGNQDGAGAMDPEQVTMTRDKILQDQDQGLDNLYDVIVRQKRIAENIETEVDIQNDLLNDIGDGIDRTTQHLLDTTKTIKRVHQKDKSLWCYWLVIVAQAIIIVALVAVPT